MRTTALLLAIAMTSPLAAAQTMYKWVDKDGKTHYTDSPPPDDAKKLAPPKGTTMPMASGTPPGPAARNPKGRNFGPEEQAALQVMCGIGIMEVLTCQLEFKRWCSLDELVNGVNGDRSKAFERDPRSDPNYDYRVNVRGTDISILAVPKRSGLASFVNFGEGTHYSFGGAAGKGDPMASGGNNCTPTFKP